MTTNKMTIAKTTISVCGKITSMEELDSSLVDFATTGDTAGRVLEEFSIAPLIYKETANTPGKIGSWKLTNSNQLVELILVPEETSSRVVI